MFADQLWSFLPIGYVLTVAVELPILCVLLSQRHSWTTRIVAGLWLTACTYPIVVLVLPVLFAGSERWRYLLVAETFAPVAECALFYLAYWRDPQFSNADRDATSATDDAQHARVRAILQDMAAIVLANLASFGIGELLNQYNWFTGGG
ncbi:MAG: hypothetical protein SGJ20_12040 [Planctomycetota bacterium]|nr:hypothetical protein [Planctomycetota bacterium]